MQQNKNRALAPEGMSVEPEILYGTHTPVAPHLTVLSILGRYQVEAGVDTNGKVFVYGNYSRTSSTGI
jgi:hypothetical protein